MVHQAVCKDGFNKAWGFSRILSYLSIGKRCLGAGLFVAGISVCAQERGDFPVNDHHIVYHDVRVDATGGVVPWYNDDPSIAYDHDIRLVWDFWIHMRNCPNGVPYYLQHQVWMPEKDDSRGLGGDQIDMTLDAWNLLYGYLGDPAIHENMQLVADYWLDHGMSAPGLPWGNLPYPYNTDLHSGEYDGDMRAGKGYLQPDKAGSFGAELIMLYKLTGKERYLQAAVKIADTLTARAIAGDENHSPWPFRVNAATGQVAVQERKGTVYDAAYTSNWTPTLQLLADLQALHSANAAKYRSTAQLLTNWLKKYPLKNNKWGPFFEDVETADYSDTEINADTMAAYILDHPEWDHNWKTDVPRILEWSEHRLGNHNFEKIQVLPLNEQTAYLVPGNSHTSRHAAAELIFDEKAGTAQRKQQAIRRLNWATYSVDVDGKNRYPNDDVWLTDGYGDYVRHYLRAMAALPELAPKDQNHLLRTSSVVQRIKYGASEIQYSKVDAHSTEVFKLGAGKPGTIRGGKMQWNPSTGVLIVHAAQRDVKLTLDNAANAK